MKNKLKSIILCSLAIAAVLSGCASQDDSDNTSESKNNEVTYNGVTNPPTDEPPKAHRVTAATTTTAVTTTPLETEAVNTTTAETSATTTVATTTTATTTTTTPSEDESSATDNADNTGIVFSVSNENSWEQNGSMVYQYELSITNNSSQDLAGWSIEVPLSDSSSELLQGWSAEYTVANSTLIITGVDFNSTIAPTAQTSVGFQIISSSPISISDSVLIANGESITIQ